MIQVTKDARARLSALADRWSRESAQLPPDDRTPGSALTPQDVERAIAEAREYCGRRATRDHRRPVD